MTLWDPMNCSPPGSSVHGDAPGKNTVECCHALLQGIFPTQGSNPGFPHCRQILYHLSHQGSRLVTSVQFSSVTRLCLTLCEPMDCSTPGSLVLRYLPGLAQTHDPWVCDTVQPSHPLPSPSPPAFNFVITLEISLFLACVMFWDTYWILSHVALVFSWFTICMYDIL